MKWMIVERDGRARGMGAAVLGVVEAVSKDLAEQLAMQSGMLSLSGLLAEPLPVLRECGVPDFAFLVLYFVHTAPGRVLYIAGVAPDAQIAQRKVAESIHGLDAGRTPLGFKIWRRSAAPADEEREREVRAGALVFFPGNVHLLYGVVEGLPYPGTDFYVVNAVTAAGSSSLIYIPRGSFALLD